MNTGDNKTHQLLTVSEVARELRVSRLTIYRYVQGGNLPALRIGETGPLRIPRESISELVRPARGEKPR
jgi:excisionase family DNA binding protein